MREKIQKYIPAAICVFALFLAINYWDNFTRIITLIVGAASPILLGFIIAYVVDILMSFYERHFFIKRKQKGFLKKIKRPVCCIGAFLTLAVVIALILWLVIPELISCTKLLITEAPPVIQGLITKIMPSAAADYLNNVNWGDVVSTFSQHMLSGIGDVAGVAYSVVTSVFSGLVTVVLGVIFAVYLLFQKERWLSWVDRLSDCILCPKTKYKISHILAVLNDSFHKYIVGQCTDVLIVGVLCTVGMLIFRLPYPGMIGVLVGVTAFIPIVGAFIGAGVGAIMICTVSPMQALFFLIFITIMQQIESNIIYPRVIGKTLGMPPVLVLAAVTVGGGTVGVWGIVFGVPLTMAIYKLTKEWVSKKEERDQKFHQNSLIR